MDKFALKPPEGFFFDEADGKHDYYMDGKLIPGVTTICGNLDKSYWMAPWKVKMCADYIRANLAPMTQLTQEKINEVIEAGKKTADSSRDTAADKGKEAHKYIELYIKGKYPETPSDPEVCAVVNKFIAWVDRVKPTFLKSEMLVASRVHEYAGTLDFIAEISGKCVLGDVKTGGTRWQDTFGLQVAAYQGAIEEMGGHIDERWVLWFPMRGGEGKQRAVTTPYDLDWKTFLGLRQAQRWVSYVKNHKENGQ